MSMFFPPKVYLIVSALTMLLTWAVLCSGSSRPTLRIVPPRRTGRVGLVGLFIFVWFVFLEKGGMNELWTYRFAPHQ